MSTNKKQKSIINPEWEKATGRIHWACSPEAYEAIRVVNGVRVNPDDKSHLKYFQHTPANSGELDPGKR